METNSWEGSRRKIKRRLSTAWHPETNGSTEQANPIIKAYLGYFVNDVQDNWAFLCPSAQLALNNHDLNIINMSPFFLDHGYHVKPLDFDTNPREFNNPRTPAQKAENIAAKLKGALEMAQASMASV
jgi:hypothetical protein